MRLSNGERKTLAEIGKKLSKQALGEIATIVKPNTIVAWHRKLIAQKFDGSQQRKALGRPRISKELEGLVVRMARRIAVGAPIALRDLWGISAIV
ncbi:MAG TPA: hypothetical protein VIH59_26480 [Candidatus Tectomicrobia bacterium]